MSFNNQNISQHQLIDVEKSRLAKKLRLKINVYHFFLIIASAIIAIIMLQDNNNRALPASITLFLFANVIYTFIIYQKVHKAYNNDFNENILDKLIPMVLPGVDFIPDVKTEEVQDLWKKSQPFRTIRSCYITDSKSSYKKSTGFKGIFKGLHFEVYDIKTLNDFDGFLMRVKRNQNVSVPVYITSKKYPLRNPITNNFAKLILNSNPSTPPPQIHIGLSSFENKLAVYSDSHDGAKEVLTNTVANAILKSHTETNNPWRFNISFIEDEVYIIMHYPWGIFTPELGKSVLDTETVNEIFTPLKEKIIFLKTLSE